MCDDDDDTNPTHLCLWPAQVQRNSLSPIVSS